MKPFAILNSDVGRIVPAPGADTWVHLAPIGDFPGVLILPDKSEEEVIQRIDRQALQDVLNNFKPKVLVDFEHRSKKPDGDTAAAAWILNLDIRADGLWGKLDLSDLGEKAIVNKRYRHLSPGFDVTTIGKKDGKKIVRPFYLDSAGLTNRHNLKALQPLSNSSSTLHPPPSTSNLTSATQQADQAGKESMQDIATSLGLDSAAEKGAVLNAIAAFKTAKTDLETAHARVAELEGAVLNQEAAAFAAANAGKIKNVEEVKKQYCANKAGTIALFASLAEVPVPGATSARNQVHNRAAAQTPAGAGVVTNKADGQAAFVQQVHNREKCDYKTAFNMARAEKPELFLEEAKQD